MENNEDMRMVVFNGTISGQQKLFAITNSNHLAMTNGEAILNRKLIPYNGVEKIDIELIKYPFKQPEIKEVRSGGRRRFFSKLHDTYYNLSDERGYLQSHMISNLESVHVTDLISTKEESMLIASEELTQEYYVRVKR